MARIGTGIEIELGVTGGKKMVWTIAALKIQNYILNRNT